MSADFIGLFDTHATNARRLRILRDHISIVLLPLPYSLSFFHFLFSSLSCANGSFFFFHAVFREQLIASLMGEREGQRKARCALFTGR